MNNQLKNIGNIPITTSIIASLYPELKSPEKKVIWLEKQGYIIRLKRGLYVVNPEFSGKLLSTELISNHLYTPSYLSMSSALRFYGLIPETVYTHQCMTIKHARNFQTPIGFFDYNHISREAFSIGIRRIEETKDCAFLIASPEKALCDLIANSPKLNLRFMKEVEIFLMEDIRFDIERLYQFNTDILEQYISVGKKSESITTLLKYLRR